MGQRNRSHLTKPSATLRHLGRLGGIIVCLSMAQVDASPLPLWQIGDDEDPFANGYEPTNEFSQETGNSNAAPGFVTRIAGDPLYDAATNPDRDDHFYQPGSYPVGFNGLTTQLLVPNPEPTSAYERALTNTDNKNSVHFILNAAQAGSQSRLRLTFELVHGGTWSETTGDGENFGTHDITVRFKTAASNTLILQRNGVDRDTRFTIDIPASSVQAVTGANTIEFNRTGPALPSGEYAWIQFDFVKMEVDTDALADGDNDGLPRWWENDNHLSDSNAADAASDDDDDTLTALQEYNAGVLSSDPRRRDTDGDGLTDSAERTAGSNPNLADTDGDGLSDFDEISVVPFSSPLLTDTDNDGAPDAWEKRVGSTPSSAASVPSIFAGAIGLNFVSADDPSGSVPWFTPAGVVPQLRWNNTIPLRTWQRPTGNTTQIGSPSTGIFTRSDGLLVPAMTASWISNENSTTSNNGSADQKLMNGFIRANHDQSMSLSLSGIPFANYHIFAFVGGGWDGQQASVKLNNDNNTLRPFLSTTMSPQKEWIEVPDATIAVPYPIGNMVRYSNLSGSSFTLTVKNEDGYSVGLHAIQIVNATLDSDGSGIPDWYEMQYALQPTSASTANADPDGDNLTNLQEYQRGSNPRKPDTDGDGLADNIESAQNALKIDSDGDGLSDHAETSAPLPSNPNLADSDSDGISDKQETELGMDPGVNPNSGAGFTGWTPSYSASPAKWEWKLEPIQLVWDHGSGATGGDNGYDDTLLAFFAGNTKTPINNPQVGSRRSIDMRLRTVNGVLTYQFESFSGEAFSAAGEPDYNIYLTDGNSPPIDLKSALGFSGYGAADISDKLRFRMLATRGAGNIWSVNFEIFNVTRNATVVSRLVSQSTAGPALDNGTATWQDYDYTPNLPTIEVHEGTRVFITPTSLETLPAFSAVADSDNDAMPNNWEDLYLLNKNSATDATQDADGDGLKNRDEFLAGTHPRLTDTDNDGVDDRIERDEGSNPLLASVRPPFANGIISNGTDFNQNGLPDAWEARYQAAALTPSADSDGDGASNQKEAAWGTNPFDAKSKIDLAMQRDGDDALLAWTRSQWKRQRIYRSSNLSSWQWLSLPFSGNGSNDTARVTGQFNLSPSAFFTMETKDRDSDGDGVSDWDEVFAASDPYQRDSTRSGSLTMDAEGNVTGNVSGDYASFANQFRNALPGGPSAQVTREQAARFLQQTSFGATMEELDHVQTLGFAGWIDDQISYQPPTYQRPAIEAMYRDLRGPRIDLSYDHGDLDVRGNNTPTAFARGAIGGKDQLRQRVAFALSQILVTSRRDPNLADRPLAMTDYYDIFLRNAFGNYREILGEVTLHPAMGRYLSHLGNQKARPEINQFPDENYARELMQLFTIGLWQLNPDGTRKLDSNGKFIPTYDNGDITEMARVFTGLWFSGQYWNEGGYVDTQNAVPMSMWAEKHDFGAKSMLGGLTIPLRSPGVANGLRDVNDALDYLFKHPNTAPFVSRQLIQFLVTSNPSPAYVGRVAAVFSNNGSGKRGDLAAVVRAILLDAEARDVRWSLGSPGFGRLKDPVQRAISIARAGRLSRFPNVSWWDYGNFYENALQSPGYSPSVFNFYRPDYRSPGILTEQQLAAPAFQITNSYTSIAFVNQLWDNTISGLRLWDTYSFNPDYRDLLEVAGNTPLLVDRANLLLCGGMMSATTRATILNMLSQIPAGDPLQRVQLTVFITSVCPEGAVQR
ncbi:MAG: DUF1800 domain-containing protein [Gloeobacteraceae cyanobacterium ES-bin-144]|nr:DUF1800 domain-containing protein [Verrucomicrobiales bacterium]